MKINSQLKSDCRTRFTRGRLAASAFMSALIGLAASTAQAQLTPCATGLFDGITWRESTVHIGDTVHFTINLTASGGNPPAGVCRLSQGTNWVVLPDGSVRIINANYTKGS